MPTRFTRRQVATVGASALGASAIAAPSGTRPDDGAAAMREASRAFPAGKAREASRMAAAPSSGRVPDGAAIADAPRADAPTVATWRRVNRVGMGNSAIEPRPITSLPSPRECARYAVLFLVGSHDAPVGNSRLIQRKAPAA